MAGTGRGRKRGRPGSEGWDPEGWGARAPARFPPPGGGLCGTDSWPEAWRCFVGARRPAVVKGGPGRPWGAWTNARLRELCGDVTVRAEVRDSDSARLPGGMGARRFGQGRYRHMKFGAFLDVLEAGGQGLYVNTQDIPAPPRGPRGTPGAPYLGGALLARLTPDFPLRPPLLSGLVPALLNIWAGHSGAAGGTSSGLHHDFHDNLYVLIRGRKRFKLWPPRAWPAMHLNGRVRTLHRMTGLFEYEDSGGDLRPDGAPLHPAALHGRGGAGLSRTCCHLCKERLEDLAWRQHTADRRAAAEAAVVTAEREMEAGGGPEAAERLQAAELALDAILEADLEGTDGVDDSVVWDDDTLDQSEEESLSSEQRTGERERGGVKAGDPAHFSSLPSSDAVEGGFEVDLVAGEMLFLPCGWFHEVTSLSTGQEGHLAFNYWFWPPDGSSPERPYTSKFWEADFTARQRDGRLFHAVQGEGTPPPQ